MNIIQKLHRETKKTTLPEFGIGDTLKVEVLIVEGDKKRSQSFTGTVIGMQGQGVSQSVVLRRVQGGYGVERILPLQSPTLANIEVLRHAKVRRAKLYYLRNAVGKAAKIKERRQD